MWVGLASCHCLCIGAVLQLPLTCAVRPPAALALLQKDILNLVYICESVGLQSVADYWHQVRWRAGMLGLDACSRTATLTTFAHSRPSVGGF